MVFLEAAEFDILHKLHETNDPESVASKSSLRTLW